MTDRTAPAAHPILPAIAARWSPRAFADREVAPDLLAICLEAARWAASASNEQPWRYLVLRRQHDPEAFAGLAATLSAGNQIWAPKAPLLLLGIARTLTAGGKPNRHAWHDLGAASAALAIQAAALGLQAHSMAGFDAARAREACALPEDHDAVTVTALGWPGDPDTLPEPQRTRETQPRLRRPIGEFAHLGAWGATGQI